MTIWVQKTVLNDQQIMPDSSVIETYSHSWTNQFVDQPDHKQRFCLSELDLQKTRETRVGV